MFAIYRCLTEDHDFGLVALAAAVCLFASLMTVMLLKRMVLSQGRERMVLLAVAAAVTGIGIWSTHFIAMLAFHTQLPATYDLGMTLVSLAVAIVMVGAGFLLGTLRRLPPVAACGGLVVGAGIGAMHYIGMAAYEIPGVILWDSGLVAWSIAVGAVVAAVAGFLTLKAQDFRGQVGAALVFTLSICGLHFTGMGAATILPDSSIPVQAAAVPGYWLAVAIAGGAFALLVLSAFGLLLEKRHLLAERRRRQQLADTAVEGLVVCDGDVIVNANTSFMALAALTEAETLGRSLSTLLDASAAERLADGALEAFEATLRGADGEAVPVKLYPRSLDFNGRPHLGVAVRDLRARNLADAQIRFLAHHDSLTGLPNRASFAERLEREIERRRRKDDGLAVVYLDLDRFKPVNDLFGHAAGDMVLKAVAERLQAVVPEGDLVARLGGDEFAVICLGDSRPAALAELSARILEALAAEIDLGAGKTVVGASIGISLFPADGQAGDALLRNADAALYRAKADGRGGFRFFEPAIGADLMTRQEMEFDLRMAISRGELSVVYQPQTAVANGDVFGFEALLRWNHPTRGLVSPAVFIPLAEETRLILPIGEWVLREACAEAARWSRPLQVAINVSGVQLHASDLATRVAEILAETGLPAERLELEVTETALIEDFDQALRSLHAIKALGVKVAMDDFGTGYSSLSNLRAFPFDKIKIDQSFVRDVHRNEQAATIVRAIVGLAKGLKLTVLAEGVESLEELTFLNAEMCSEAQGYYLGRPQGIEAFADLIAAPPERRKAG